MRSLRPFALSLCFAAAAVNPRIARAGDPVSPSSEPLGKEEAIRAFGKGRDLILAGKQAEALPVLTRSFQLLPSPNTELLIAHAEKGLGRAARAATRYEHVVVSAEAEIAKGNSKYEETVAEAKRALGELLPGLGVIEITAPGGTQVSVTRGPDDVVSFSGSSRVLAEPGSVRVKAGDAAEHTVEVAAGQTQKLDLTAKLPKEKPSAPIASKPSQSKSGLGALGVTGIVVGGVGLVGVGVFAGMGASAKSSYDELVACGCSLSEAEALREDGKQAQLIANVSLGVGLGLAAGGVTLLIVDLVSSPKKADEAAFARFAPIVALDSNGGFVGLSAPLF